LSVMIAACGGGSDGVAEPDATSTTFPDDVTGETPATEDTTFGSGPFAEESTCPEGQPCRLEMEAMQLPLDITPGAFAIDGSTAWITDQDAGLLVQIDLDTGAELGRVSIVGAGDVVVGPDGVWVASAGWDDNLVRLIDPDSMAVISEVEPDSYRNAGYLAVDGHALWATVDATGEVVHIDAGTGEVVATVVDYDNLFAGDGADLVAAFGKVWVIDAKAGRLLSIDPGSNQITDRWDQLGFAAEESDGGTTIFAAGPVALAADDASVWIAADTKNPENEFVVGSSALFRIDPVSGTVTDVAELTLESAPGHPGLAIGTDAVWFIDRVSGDVVRVDIATGREATIDFGNAVGTGVIIRNGTVWVLLGGYGDSRLAGIDEGEAADVFSAAIGG